MSEDEERKGLRALIAGVHNVLIDESMEPSDLELTDIKDPDTEADVLLPEFGLNFRQWRRWSVEKQLEVLIHEFAHVEDYDDNHRPTFWNRMVRMVDRAESHREVLESLFDTDIDFQVLREKVVESVHDEVIDRRMDTVRKRRRELREAFDLN